MIARVMILAIILSSLLPARALPGDSPVVADPSSSLDLKLKPPIEQVESLTMMQAIKFTLKEQPLLHARVARVDVDSAEMKRERSTMLPLVQAGGVGNLGPTVVNGFNGLFAAAARGNFGFDANMRWTLWDFGANFHRYKARKEDYKSTQQEFQMERAESILRTKLAYFQALAARELKEIAELDVKNRVYLAESARHFFETGLQSRLDWEQAKVDLAQAEQGLEESIRQLQVAFNALNQAMGRDPLRNYALEDEPLPSLPARSGTALMDEGRTFRPDLKAASDKIAAAKERLISSRREFLPKIDALGGLGYLDDSAILQGSNNRYASGALVAFSPLYTGGRLTADLAKARAEIREAEANYQNTEQIVTRQVMDAIAAIRATNAKYETARRQVDYAGQTYAYATERYKAQLASYLEVSTAQTLLINSRANLARNKYEFAGADALLQFAIGRDYQKYRL